MLATLSVMVMLLAINVAALNRLSREVKGVERRQIQRLDPSHKPPFRASQTVTNQPSAK